MSPNCSLLFSNIIRILSGCCLLLLAATARSNYDYGVIHSLLLLQQVLRLRFFRPAFFFPLSLLASGSPMPLIGPGRGRRGGGRTAEERKGSRQADRGEPSRHPAHPHRNPYACWALGWWAGSYLYLENALQISRPNHHHICKKERRRRRRRRRSRKKQGITLHC